MDQAYLGRILIVEDDHDMAILLESFLKRKKCRTHHAVNLHTLEKLLQLYSFDAVLLDLNLGDESGLEAIPTIIRIAPYAKIVVMTAYGSIDLAVDAMEKGATTFITKSDDPSAIVSEVVKRLTSSQIHDKDSSTSNIGFPDLVGRSLAMQELKEQIDQVRGIDSLVLVLGESGTGKELVARAIHLGSNRANERFEAINCGAIQENLLEAELFGYKKGAFTDAKTDRMGLFETCNEGTLFLDEIGELPLNLQVKLLRVLQEKEIRPLGENKSRNIKTRVICATNRNLEKDVRAGRFREDLYFRLSVFPIKLPPLRNRLEDIPELVAFFIEKFNTLYNRNVCSPGLGVMSRLSSYSWPGNIRQLQNSLERAVVLSKDNKISLDNMILSFGSHDEDSEEVSLNSEESVIYAEAKEMFERNFLRKILSVAKGNVSEAARISGRFRSDIYRLMEKYGIDQNNFR